MARFEGLGELLKQLNQKLWDVMVGRRLVLRASAEAAYGRTTIRAPVAKQLLPSLMPQWDLNRPLPPKRPQGISR